MYLDIKECEKELELREVLQTLSGAGGLAVNDSCGCMPYAVRVQGLWRLHVTILTDRDGPKRRVMLQACCGDLVRSKTKVINARPQRVTCVDINPRNAHGSPRH